MNIRHPPAGGPDLVVFGSLTIDNVMRADGEILPQTFGGNCIYAALGARLWSDKVGVVSRYGAGYREDVLAQLRRLGIDTGGIGRVRGPHRRNTAFRYREDGGRSRYFPPEVLETIPFADRARFVDSATLPDAQANHRQFAPDSADLPPAWRTTMRGIHFATAPLTKLLDVAQMIQSMKVPRPIFLVDSLWLDRPDKDMGEADALLKMASALMPSEQDLENYRPDAPYDAVIAELMDRGANAMVLKRGSAGCRVYLHGRDPVDVPALLVEAVDPTGAGDSFCGGVLAGLVHTGDLVQAVHYGVVSASFCVERAGPAGLLAASREEAVRRMETLSRRTGVALDRLPLEMAS